MKATDVNSKIIDGYIRLLENLSPVNKLDLISKLTNSVKSDIADKKKSFYKAFGAWDSRQSAEEIIKGIRNSRAFNRQIEEL